MAYIALQQFESGGQCASDDQLELIQDQAEERALEGAQKNIEVAPIPQTDPTPPRAQSPLQLMVVQYKAEIDKTISNHRDSALQILREVPSHDKNTAILSE